MTVACSTREGLQIFAALPIGQRKCCADVFAKDRQHLGPAHFGKPVAWMLLAPSMRKRASRSR